jgi:hypothetical protein
MLEYEYKICQNRVFVIANVLYKPVRYNRVELDRKSRLLTLHVLFPPFPEIQMLLAVMAMSSNLQTKLVIVSVTTSRRTGEMEVASSDGLPHPDAGA